MARTIRGILGATRLSLAVLSCGGNGETTTVVSADDDQTTTTPTLGTPAPTSVGAKPTIPTGFPIPIPEGGTVSSSHVEVGFGEGDFEDIVDFYREYSASRDGIENELFDGGFEWQIVSARGGPIVTTVTPGDGTAVVSIRLL